MKDQLFALDFSIQQNPDVAVNYLLRGEYWLTEGDVLQAQDDLWKARELAQAALADSDWGYIYQSYIDRADRMLALAEQMNYQSKRAIG